MNQIKIGKFIYERRKSLNLTQLQLAEKLNVTDRAVSKWERGKSMPDCAIMTTLCDILEITVNDLLCGEIIDKKESETKNQELLLNLSNELEQKNKTIWSAMKVILATSMVALLLCLFLSAFLIPEGPIQLVASLVSCVLFMIPCFYALKLEVNVGVYRCKNCSHEFVPTYREALNAMHRGFTRKLKCPNCHKRTWCKKVINKK